MLSVSEALNAVLAAAEPLPAVRVPLRDALGLVLAESIASDVDSPPHDKSMVDGYAVLVSDLANGPVVLAVLEEVTAGAVPTAPLRNGHATRIMTGAPTPVGTEAVVMVEKSELATSGSTEQVRIVDSAIKTGQNILRQGVSMRAGDVVLQAGHELRPAEIGLLAEVGRAEILARPRVTVAILSTGNEIVPVDQIPGVGHIRNSNGPMLAACVASCGAIAQELGIVRDEREALQQAVLEGLRADVLILSGGVSAGVLDLVPGVLREAGVREVFHKVKVKPGKPLWFGVLLDGMKHKLVFGLAGNPVGSLVGFESLIRPALQRLSGRDVTETPEQTAALAAPFQHKGDRPTFHPGKLDGASASVRPLEWKGSADLRTLVNANVFICFPAGDRAYAAGDRVYVRPM